MTRLAARASLPAGERDAFRSLLGLIDPLRLRLPALHGPGLAALRCLGPLGDGLLAAVPLAAGLLLGDRALVCDL